MKQRWLPVGVIAGALFATNVVARLIVKFGFDAKDGSQIGLGLAAFGAVALAMIGSGFWWARRYPTSRVTADLGVAALVSCALAVLVGPFLVGSRPFAEGSGTFLALVGYYLGFTGGGAIFGVLLATAFGKDWKSQAWKRYGESVRSKPRRVAR